MSDYLMNRMFTENCVILVLGQEIALIGAVPRQTYLVCDTITFTIC
jgi:hypothetical protein